eukprot:Amastigsp_a510533_183.p5 type:complete len:102 gc:universal Amastigsp_a510533_183:1167-1472(+)
MTGAPTFMAASMILQIFIAWVSESDPPETVKSCENTNASRPLIMPWPVTTPSPGMFSMPEKSVHRCVTKASCSRNEPASRSTSMRSRAVSLPPWCCLSMRF